MATPQVLESARTAAELTRQAADAAQSSYMHLAADAAGAAAHGFTGVDPFVFRFSIFILAVFVGYYVVWSVTPALHTPLMAVTNAISSVIIVGALVASAASGSSVSKYLGLLAVVLASINIFGGFAVTERMLAMYKKKDRS